ncbi:MAG: hypothetical protein EOP83_22855 [Verrucomicrobiaceae bacterium]|nr:MAG: hypothetical protein EOP83_22855 [Verrucomicrobiaceae bacterium]
MKLPLTSLFAGTAGLLLGWASTRQMTSDAVSKETIPSLLEASLSSPAATSNSTSNITPGHDFAKLRRLMRDWNFLPEGAQQSIERMSADELRGLLTEPWPDGLGNDNLVRQATREAAARELFSRDADGSFQWAEGLGASGRETLLQLVRIASMEDPRFAKPWVDKLKSEGADDLWTSSMARTAVEGAISRGADAVLEAEEIFGKDVPGFNARLDEFDPHFDFGKLVDNSKKRDFQLQVLKAWASVNREAAFEKAAAQLREKGPEAQPLPGIIYSGVASTSGEAAAAEWFAGKLDEMPQDLRGQIVGALSGTEAPSEARVEAVMKMLPTQEDRIQFIAGNYSPFSPGGPILNALKMLDSQEAQVQALVTTAGRYSWLVENNPEQGKMAVDRFEETMDALAIPEEKRTPIRAAYTP